MRMEDLNYYKMNEKICLGANNYLKSAAAQDVLNNNAASSTFMDHANQQAASAFVDPTNQSGPPT